MKVSTVDEIKEIDLAAHVRKRPTMFLGGIGFTGFITLIGYLLDEIFESIDNDGSLQFELNSTGNIQIEIKSKSIEKLAVAIKGLDLLPRVNRGFTFDLLIAVCEHLNIEVTSNNQVTILQAKKGRCRQTAIETTLKPDVILLVFGLDFEIFKSFDLNYQHINEFLIQYAYLNPAIKLVSIDNRQEYQKNIFAFKRGVAEHLDALIAGKTYYQPMYRYDLKTDINGYSYQVSFCYHDVWFAKSYIRTFANNIETYLGGSLLDGVLHGMMDAIKRAALSQNIDIRISKKTITDGLILIAAVKGPDIIFHGSTKRRLGMPKIKKNIRLYIYKELTAFMEADQERATNLIRNFIIR